MNLTMPISSDPLNGLVRTLTVIDFDWSLIQSNILLSTSIAYSFAQKGSKGTSRIKDYKVELICDNNSTVDPKTGEFVLVNDDGIAQSKDAQGNDLVGIGQYDFYVEMAQQGPIDIIGLIRMLVQRADTLKRFDI